MAPSRNLKVAVTVAFIFYLTFLLPKSVGVLHFSGYNGGLQPKKMVLGSRPPGCVNKCLNCRPCIATLVIPSNQRNGFIAASHGEDDSYYLLSWKCRCGDKLYQP